MSETIETIPETPVDLPPGSVVWAISRQYVETLHDPPRARQMYVWECRPDERRALVQWADPDIHDQNIAPAVVGRGFWIRIDEIWHWTSDSPYIRDHGVFLHRYAGEPVVGGPWQAIGAMTSKPGEPDHLPERIEVAHRDHDLLTTTSAVYAAREILEDAQAQLKHAMAYRDMAVRAELREGRKGPGIGRAAGLSRGRIYQIRDGRR